MKKLLACICCVMFGSTAMAEIPVNQWLDRLADRGTQIEIIRVASEKNLVAAEETDAEIATILEEAEALEEDTSDHEKVEDSS